MFARLFCFFAMPWRARTNFLQLIIELGEPFKWWMQTKVIMEKKRGDCWACQSSHHRTATSNISIPVGSAFCSLFMTINQFGKQFESPALGTACNRTHSWHKLSVTASVIPTPPHPLRFHPRSKGMRYAIIASRYEIFLMFNYPA